MACGGQTYLVKVGNDLIEQPQTLHTHVVSVQLDVKVVEVGNGRKENADLRVGLIVEILQVEGDPPD